MVINTNTQALATANSLNASSVNLSKALARLSSGSKIIVPSDDAAGLAVSSRLEAQVKRLDGTVSNVINAISFTQTQDGFLKTVDKAFRRMGELAMLALDTTKSSEDLGLYNQEFMQLKDFISASSNQTFNSVALFSSTPIPVTVDSEGITFAMAAINLEAPAYQAAINNGKDAWTLTTDAWQVSKDGYKTAATSYKTSVDLWRTNAGAWAATNNGGVKFAADSIVNENVTSADANAKTLAAGSFTSAGVIAASTLTSATASAGTFTSTGHGLAVGDKVLISSGTSLVGVSAATTYYVAASADANTFTLSATAGGSAITTAAGTAITIESSKLTGVAWEADDEIFTKASHGLSTGQKVQVTAIGGATGAVTFTDRYVKKLTDNTFELYSDSALTTKVTTTVDGASMRLNVEGTNPLGAKLSSELKKGQFVDVNPITSGEDANALKIASGSVVAINQSVQDISAFATGLNSDYDNVNLNSTASAKIAIDLVKKATTRIASDRAILGAMQSRLNFTHERLSVTKENLVIAISRIADVDVAEETTQYARYQILVQSGTSMLREANAMPQSALKLLQ